MIHGEEKTIQTKVPTGAVYQKRVKYCRAHGWIDLFMCGGAAAWEVKHGQCSRSEQPQAIGLELPPAMGATA